MKLVEETRRRRKTQTDPLPAARTTVALCHIGRIVSHSEKGSDLARLRGLDRSAKGNTRRLQARIARTSAVSEFAIGPHGRGTPIRGIVCALQKVLHSRGGIPLAPPRT
jgi:hypothetical protein